MKKNLKLCVALIGVVFVVVTICYGAGRAIEASNELLRNRNELMRLREQISQLQLRSKAAVAIPNQAQLLR
jgi:hypothetical protein